MVTLLICLFVLGLALGLVAVIASRNGGMSGLSLRSEGSSRFFESLRGGSHGGAGGGLGGHGAPDLRVPTFDSNRQEATGRVPQPMRADSRSALNDLAGRRATPPRNMRNSGGLGIPNRKY